MEEVGVPAESETAVMDNPAPMAQFIKTFVFLDLETTNLLSIEHPKIMEMCLVAVHREALLQRPSVAVRTELPRVLDKLTLCVYPNKPVSEKSFQLTGLQNSNLCDKKLFDMDVVMMLKAFLRRQEQPVCLVAHNGDKFDFRLLRTELVKLGERLPDHVRCADSLKAFAETDEQTQGSSFRRPTRISYALGEIYKRSFGADIPDAHNAESDVNALILACMTRGEILCKWMDTNAVAFNDIELYYCPSPPKNH